MAFAATITDTVRKLVADPPPEFSFELSESGLAWNSPKGKGFTPLEPGTIRVSPSEENVLRPDNLARAVREVTGESRGGKRRAAALILPDYAGRTTILDFDSFPSKADEQTALLKFRLRKAVPFDIDSASVSFHAQPRPAAKKTDVLASAISLETLARYEAPFRAAGLHLGYITTSTLATLEMVPANGWRVLVKMSGLVLTVAVTDAGALRVLRMIELPESSPMAIDEHLSPTLTWVEDEWKHKPEAIYPVGFDPHWLDPELPVQPLPSTLGQPTAWNAGLLGFLAAGGRP